MPITSDNQGYSNSEAASNDNVFANPYTKQSVIWSAQGAAIFISHKGNQQNAESYIFYALNGVRIAYARTITTKYPIGTGAGPIKLLGVPRGTADLATLIGPQVAINNFIKIFGDACKPFSITIRSSTRVSQCASGSIQEIALKDCVGSDLVYDLQSQDNGLVIAQGTFRVEFNNMSWTSGGRHQEIAQPQYAWV